MISWICKRYQCPEIVTILDCEASINNEQTFCYLQIRLYNVSVSKRINSRPSFCVLIGNFDHDYKFIDSELIRIEDIFGDKVNCQSLYFSETTHK